MRFHLIVIPIFYINSNLLFSQVLTSTAEQPRPILLLKADCRSIILQPKLSLEYLFVKKISLEIGACKFWSGQKIHQEDALSEIFGFSIIGIGPSKVFDIFSDIKYSYRNGLYWGIGYLYRYSYFNNVKYGAEVSEYKYQYYKQSEKSYSNFLRLTIGAHMKVQNKNIYINPYLATMYGNSNIHFQIDTTGGNPQNYSYHAVKPAFEDAIDHSL